IVFFNVSGGPYGIEDTVPSFGPGLTLVLLLLTPLLWSLPVSLAMSELASAMPDEGGYVTWTTRAFGPFWGFQVGWWSWLDSFVDVAVYPALFVEYLRYWHPTMAPLERWLLAVVFIAVLTMLNLLGVRPTGRAAVALSAAALAPVGGAWLGHVVAAGAVLRAAGLFMALLLTTSRVPYVLAREGALPRAFGVLHPRFGTPWLAVLVSSAAYAACAVFSFKELIVLNVWLYLLALLGEPASFLSLRAAAPGLPRPWRVPGGWTGALAVTVLPALFALGAMATAGWGNTLAGIGVALTGPVVWWLARVAGSRR